MFSDTPWTWILYEPMDRDNSLPLSLLHSFHIPLPCSQLLIKWHSVYIFNFDHLQDSKKGWAIDKEFFSVLNSRICIVVTN